MLPYESTLPFGTAQLYRLLRKLKFEWTSFTEFRVSASQLKEPQKIILRIIYENARLQERTPLNGYTSFKLLSLGQGPSVAVHPFRFTTRRNNGKLRELVIPHPISMIEMARFFDEQADSILYFTNRSPFSIRRPVRVARAEIRRDRYFEENRDDESFDLEQHDLEYDHVTSFFSYKKYNNIHRFYSSREFRACERKYPILARADISKCFDSIYTHTISWVTNGREASKDFKTRNATRKTFGGLFDAHMQALNYGETSGIVIGPEFSRIFAEIILQEIDVRLERDLHMQGLTHGLDYEIMRYVDDYFIFVSSQADVDKIEEALSGNLAHFKLHLNDGKREVLTTPLKAQMSVAKYQIQNDLSRLTVWDADAEQGHLNLHFSPDKAILEYKATLLDVDSDHGDLANFYLYTLIRRMDATFRQYRRFDAALEKADLSRARSQSATKLAKYAIAVADVAFFIYAGAPSASHSIKLARVVVGILEELNRAKLSTIELASVKDKLRRELTAQLVAVRDEKSFGVHTLNLLDCLVHLQDDSESVDIAGILERRGIDLQSLATLDALAILTLLRACGRRPEATALRDRLIERANAIVSEGAFNRDLEAQRVILRLSLPTCPYLTVRQIHIATELSEDDVWVLRGSANASLFAWDADDHYYQRLLLKTARSVY
jgi:hypothetical protein